MDEVAEHLTAIRARMDDACRRAGRDAGAVRLVAVSKKQPLERVKAAYALGLRDFGENYLQELERRKAALPEDARWHMIGHVQSNKAKKALLAALVHGVDSERVARALGKASVEAGRSLDVLLEVNVGSEVTKAGVSLDEAPALARAVLATPGLRLQGLMCIPPEGGGRAPFARLRALRDALEAGTGAQLPELSMGMSGDFEEAILEGATLVRIGTALFGARVG